MQEIYVGITVYRSADCPVVMASAAGGVDNEEVARVTPEKIIKIWVNTLLGLLDYQAREIAVNLDLPKPLWLSFGKIVQGLWQVYLQNDATLAEINPLVITSDQRLMALDGKMIVDDNALFRHPDLEAMRDVDEDAPAEIQARAHGLAYIQLDGEIGCMVNGAGLAMATMDIIQLFGGHPANFLDIGGGAGAEKVAAAMRIILEDEHVQVVLINIFGGITRCDEVARGIIRAMAEVKPTVPMVVRLVGTNAAEGRQLLADAHMLTAETLAEAAEKAVQAAQGGAR